LLCAGYLRKPVTGSEGLQMDYVVGGVAALLVFAYLLYALLKPEKF